MSAAFVVAVAAIGAPAFAGPVVDQNNAPRLAGFCHLNDLASCGQSFRQSNANISGSGIFIDPSYGDGTAATVTLSVFSGYGSTGGTGLVASGSALNVTRNSGWVDVFWDAVDITPGNQYYLVASATNALVASYGAAAYANGNALYAGSTTVFSNFDLVFRTYAGDRVTQVPEPGSLGLVAGALLGLAAVVRKRAVSKRNSAA